MTGAASRAVGEERLGDDGVPAGRRIGTRVRVVVGVAVEAESGWNGGGVEVVVEDGLEGSSIGLVGKAEALVCVGLAAVRTPRGGTLGYDGSGEALRGGDRVPRSTLGGEGEAGAEDAVVEGRRGAGGLWPRGKGGQEVGGDGGMEGGGARLGGEGEVGIREGEGWSMGGEERFGDGGSVGTVREGGGQAERGGGG